MNSLQGLSPFKLAPILILSIASLTGTMSLTLTHSSQTILFEWPFSLQPPFSFMLSLIFDFTSMTFLTTVLLITAAVYYFSASYMLTEYHKPRFTHLIALFVLSMALLILIPNLFALMLGWDGLGIISFILVIYYANKKSLGAGMITALTNRLGDALLLISLAITLSQHWLTTSLWALAPSPMIILMFAAMTKSAQLPFSAWLPAAMAAPTPISALVHSSTLVTAGIFLLIRLFPSLSLIPLFSPMMLLIGSATMIYASTIALQELDMKKVIALSTLSQLGLMILTLGLMMPLITLFHLLTHALFKALLFISAGIYIHLNSHSQDIRSTSSHLMPLASSSVLISSLALSGFPFLSAFFSKDIILENFSSSFSTPLLFFAAVSTAFTASYSARLILFSSSNSKLEYTSENTLSNIIVPLLLMPALAVIAGSLLNWTLIQPQLTLTLSLTQKLYPLSAGILGATIMYFSFLSSISPAPPSLTYPLSSLLLLTPTSSILPIKLFAFSFPITPTIDQGWQEAMGPQGISSLLKVSSLPSISPMNLFTNLQLPLSLTLIIPLLLW